MTCPPALARALAAWRTAQRALRRAERAPDVEDGTYWADLGTAELDEADAARKVARAVSRMYPTRKRIREDRP